MKILSLKNKLRIIKSNFHVLKIFLFYNLIRLLKAYLIIAYVVEPHFFNSLISLKYKFMIASHIFNILNTHYFMISVIIHLS